MNKALIIIFDGTLPAEKLEIFFEAIRSSYISKQANKNVFIISAPIETTPELVHKNIASKIDKKIPFIVTVFQSFFGNLSPDIWDWLKITFPKMTFTYPFDEVPPGSPKS